MLSIDNVSLSIYEDLTLCQKVKIIVDVKKNKYPNRYKIILILLFILQTYKKCYTCIL